jgi:MFS superfamily sulfate permease-like transporter
MSYFKALFVSGWAQPLLLPRLADVLFFMVPVMVMHVWGRWFKRNDSESSRIQPYLIGLNLVLLTTLWGDGQAFIYFAF